MHLLQEMKLDRIRGYLSVDQGSIDFLNKITLETIIKKTDVQFARNAFGDMHIGEIFKVNLERALHHSEKTRHSKIRRRGFMDLLYAFSRCEVLNPRPDGSNSVMVMRDGIPTFVYLKSGPKWANSKSFQKSLEKAADWLDEHGDTTGEIVFCAENGDGDSWSREPFMFDDHMVRELYGAACLDFFTGQANPTELIDRQVAEALVETRKMCPHHRNAIMINRKTMLLQQDLLNAGNKLHGCLLVNENGSPIWGNWLRAKELIGITAKANETVTRAKAA